MNEDIILAAAHDANRLPSAVSRTSRSRRGGTPYKVMSISFQSTEPLAQEIPSQEPQATAATKHRGGRKPTKSADSEPIETLDVSRPDIGRSETLGQGSPSLGTIHLDEIVVDPAIQSRAGLNRQTVEDYTERLKAGDEFPALNLFKIEDKLFLADGFHTYQAAVEAGLHEIPVYVHLGSRKDAIKFSLQANVNHGLPRNNDDKRRAARLALEQFPELSDGAIAEMIKVSQPFVSGIRRELKTDLSPATRLGRDGKKRKSPKSKASRAKKFPNVAVDQTPMPMELAEPSADESKDAPCDAHSATAFDEDQAWEGVEDYLRTRLESWPRGMRKTFGDRLRKFADNECH